MATVEAELTLTGPAETPVQTGTLTDDGLMVAKPLHVGYKEAWRQTLEKVSMMRFIRFPDLEDEGLKPPVSRAIAKATAIINSMLAGTYPPPTRVIPDGEGGIVFERWDKKGDGQRIVVSAVGIAELSTFEGSRLVSRSPMQ
jgi:hypothetical protein